MVNSNKNKSKTDVLNDRYSKWTSTKYQYMNHSISAVELNPESIKLFGIVLFRCSMLYLVASSRYSAAIYGYVNGS